MKVTILFNLDDLFFKARVFRLWGEDRPYCTMSGIFKGYGFLKTYSISWKMRRVSTLAVGAFRCGCQLNMLLLYLSIVYSRLAIKYIVHYIQFNLHLHQVSYRLIVNMLHERHFSSLSQMYLIVLYVNFSISVKRPCDVA